MRVFSTFEEIEAAAGQEIGLTDWVEITQERVDLFADATDYHQWIHVDQERAAAELLRVCRPGGKIGLANWTPDGLSAQNVRTIGAHVPPPLGLRPPTRWGAEEGLRELFADQISALQVQRRTLVQRFRSPQHWLEILRTYFGPVAQAFKAVGPQGEDALARDLLAVNERFNRSGDATLVLPLDYLEVVATRR